METRFTIGKYPWDGCSFDNNYGAITSSTELGTVLIYCINPFRKFLVKKTDTLSYFFG